MAKTTDLRIISGRYRGRILKAPRFASTHPMGARERLALFNMVNVEQAVVLDAYAGSGAIGLEALSRGAREVIFVEKSRPVAQTLQENIHLLDAQGEVVITSVSDFCQAASYHQCFDVIFADPPYDLFNPQEITQLIPLLRTGGILALSSPASLDFPELPGLRISSTHTYARARLTIYRSAI